MSEQYCSAKDVVHAHIKLNWIIALLRSLNRDNVTYLFIIFSIMTYRWWVFCVISLQGMATTSMYPLYCNVFYTELSRLVYHSHLLWALMVFVFNTTFMNKFSLNLAIVCADFYMYVCIQQHMEARLSHMYRKRSNLNY